MHGGTHSARNLNSPHYVLAFSNEDGSPKYAITYGKEHRGKNPTDKTD